MIKKIVILDRDGVINEDRDDYIKSPEEWIAIPKSLEAIAKLNLAGYSIAVATNQSGIGRNLFNVNILNAIHQKMQLDLHKIGGKIDAIFFCPHVPEDKCECRKPKSGMMKKIANYYQKSSLKGIPIVGDHIKDLIAGSNFQANPHLVLTGKGMNFINSNLPAETIIHLNLMEFVNYYLDN